MVATPSEPGPGAGHLRAAVAVAATCPASTPAVSFRAAKGDPILFINNPPGVSPGVRRTTLDGLSKVRAPSRGPTKAGAVRVGSSRTAPYAKPPPPPAKATAQAPRQRSRPPAAHTVQAKTQAVVRQVDPDFQSSRARPGTVSQDVVIAAATALASTPKAKRS